MLRLSLSLLSFLYAGGSALAANVELKAATEMSPYDCPNLFSPEIKSAGYTSPRLGPAQGSNKFVQVCQDHLHTGQVRNAWQKAFNECGGEGKVPPQMIDFFRALSDPFAKRNQTYLSDYCEHLICTIQSQRQRRKDEVSKGEEAIKAEKSQAIARGQALAVTARTQATSSVLKTAEDTAERRTIVAADSKLAVDNSAKAFSRAVEKLVETRGQVAKLEIPQASPACVAARAKADQSADGALRMARNIIKSWGEQESQGIWKFFKEQQADAAYYRNQQERMIKR